LNESRVFSQPQVEQEFKNFVTVQLHTDKVPPGVNQVPDAADATVLRDEKFNNFALPYYVVVRVKGKVLERTGYYDKGVINNSAEFVRFLQAARQVR
jgi:hypothetical protein